MKLLNDRIIKLSTPVISDALNGLGVSGGLIGIKQMNLGKKLFGKAFTLKYIENMDDKKTYSAADYIDDVPSGSVIVIDNAARTFCTTWGGILTDFAIRRNINGTVINGLVRDIEFIRSTNYPLYSIGAFMQTGKGRVVLEATQIPITIGNTIVNPSDWIFGDENGCLAIPKELLDATIEMAEKIERNEKQILIDISSGSSLKHARVVHNYSTPWKE